MLGSDHAGERDAAARQAEKFRRKHGLTWAELLALQPEPRPVPEPPAQAAWTPPAPPPPSPAPQTAAINWRAVSEALGGITYAVGVFFVIVGLAYWIGG